MSGQVRGHGDPMTEDGPAESDDGESTTREARLERAAKRRDFDADALERAHEDARFTLTQTLQLFSDLSGKAFRLIRLNALVITILVAVASQVRVRTYVNVLSVASLLLFVASTLFALVGYLVTTVDRGIDAATFDKLTEYKLRESEYLNWILTLGYPKWIDDVVEQIETKERWIRRSLVAFLAGITTLLVGILFGVY
jgi:Ca2+/Na+ antiporter